MFLAKANHLAKQTIFKYKHQGQYQDITWFEAREQVALAALGLKTLGIGAGERVAILSENRPEWAMADLAILGLGASDVPIYATSSPEEVAYVVRHAAAKAIFVSNDEQLQKIIPQLSELPSLKTIIIFEDDANRAPQVFSWLALQQLVKVSASEALNAFEDEVKNVKCDDLATIIYTSGTTGPPKGVMLTHQNFLINCEDAKEAIRLGRNDQTLSFLPLSHVFERMAGFYFPLMVGAPIAYAESMNTVPENLLEVKPTMACAVPRFYEKIYQKIMTSVEQSTPIKKKLIKWALTVGYATIPYRLKRLTMPSWLYCQYQIARLLVFKKLKKSLGGRLTQFISGGAALPRYLGEFFYAAGIMILEGYGLTETSPVIAVNREQQLKFGTVGIPFQHVDVRIDSETKEICVRGPSVMRGYYKNEAATQEVIRDGWFHTGDIGCLDEEGFLTITDRMKDIIVTSGGKNISPQNIENTILKSSFIQQMVVLGDGRNYLVALIVPDFTAVQDYLKLAHLSKEQIIKEERVNKLIQEEITRLTKTSAGYEQIKYFRLLLSEFTQTSGELTPTLKVKRKIVQKKYASLIDEMYQTGAQWKS